MARKKTKVKAGGPTIHLSWDFGHSNAKGVLDGVATHEFPHAIVRLTESEFMAARSSSMSATNPQIFEFEGEEGSGFYAVGYAAQSRAQPPIERELRYQKGYMQPMAAAMLASLIEIQPPRTSDVSVTALYPVDDTHAVQMLKDSIRGEFVIRPLGMNEMVFNVRSVMTMPEPVAGLLYLVLDDECNEIEGWSEQAILVCDIGGGTVNIVPIETGWQPASLEARSFKVEANPTVEEFKKRLFKQFPQLVPSVTRANITVIRDSLREDRWVRRGNFDIAALTRELKDDLMERIISEAFSQFNFYNFTAIVFTGGGSGLLHKQLEAYVGDPEAVYFSGSLGEIQLSNVRGARKAYVVQEFARQRAEG